MTSFTYVPDFNAEYQNKPNVRVTKFGDGYEQRQANGINSQIRNWSLTFSLRTDSEAGLIVAFLETQGAVTPFDWTDFDGNTFRYVCRQWTRKKVRSNMNTITCNFEQVYEP